MFGAVTGTLHLNEHFGAFVEMLVLEHVPPHSGISLHGNLPLQVTRAHSGHDFLSRRKRPGIIRCNDA
jgi:hypothetical protein